MTSDDNVCVGCGGDGKYRNAFGNITTCPFCRGTRHKGNEQGLGLKDVTKTKERKSNVNGRPPRAEQPISELGLKLKSMIEAKYSSAAKRQEILNRVIDFEETKGRITETEFKKVRKAFALGDGK
jgi:hypothetical protein